MGEQATPAIDLEDPVATRVAWGRLAEPCDLQAGALVAALGPGTALRWLRGERVDGFDPAAAAGPWPRPVWERARARWLPRWEALDPGRELRAMERFGGRVLIPGDPWWPSGLDDLGAAAPHCLWVRGDPAVLSALAGSARGSAVAMVGARASTGYGEHVAGELTASLAAGGTAIVSGGAYGIDAVAHRTALATGGTTVAVMAGGLDRFYPAGNTTLLEAVVREGAVVAELGPGSSPSRSRFLTRNRLIAALADVCVVVEAGWRSGTLSTAMHAARLLRPVAAVPGPVTSAASAGCHRLIRDGVAVCVTDAGEVRDLLSPAGEDLPPEPSDEQVRRPRDAPAATAPEHARVWEAIPVRGGASIDSIARVGGFAVAEVRAALGSLELAGHVRRDGDRYRRAGR